MTAPSKDKNGPVIAVDASVLSLPRSGVANVLLGLYNACLEIRPELNVRFLHRSKLHSEVDSTIPVRRIGRFLNDPLWRRWQIPKIANQVDVFHFPWNGNVPNIKHACKVVTTLHDVLPLMIPSYFREPDHEKMYKNRVQLDLDRTDLLITDSHFSRNAITNFFHLKEEPLVLYPGSTLRQPDQNLVNPETKRFGKYFVYLGGYHPRKGLEFLLRVFLQNYDRILEGSRLLLVGQPSRLSMDFHRLLQQGLDRGIVEELGYVNDERLSALLAGALALVYPSLYEGFGLPPLEAMSLGAPVITTRGSSIPEVCGDAAIYIDPNDAIAFSSALETVLKNDDIRRDLSAKGLRQASKFDWRQTATKYLDAIENLIGRSVK